MLPDALDEGLPLVFDDTNVPGHTRRLAMKDRAAYGLHTRLDRATIWGVPAYLLIRPRTQMVLPMNIFSGARGCSCAPIATNWARSRPKMDIDPDGAIAAVDADIARLGESPAEQ